MSRQAEVEILRITDPSSADYGYPTGLSFFDPYLRYYVEEILRVDGEAFVAREPQGTISGIFIYDTAERIGSIFATSREVFDEFYHLGSFESVFAELKTEHDCEIYDIYNVELRNLGVDHRFRYEISIAEKEQLQEIEHFMISANPRMNKKWIQLALDAGEKCFFVRLGTEIAGLGWLSIVNKIGRLHSLYVRPEFRRMGIGQDILFARFLWLKSKQAQSAFSEISRYNSPSWKIALKGQMSVAGQVFQYFKNETRPRNLTKAGI